MRTGFLPTLCALFFALVQGNDPSPGWLSYAVWTAPNEGKVTAVNTTWTVPSRPKRMYGSNAPGWWFGIQTTKGDGALIQPILAWDYHGEEYSIFNACFDWTDRSWHTSREVNRVSPGDKITSSIAYRENDNSYDMYIEANGQSITTNYKLERRQEAVETTVYFVLEHSPSNCEAYPESGVCTFENIMVEVDGKLVDEPEWEAKQETPKCNSTAAIVDSKTIKFTWNSDALTKPSKLHDGQCKKGTTECKVSATKTMCCTPGEFCIKNVGCTCADGDCAAGPSKWSANVF